MFQGGESYSANLSARPINGALPKVIPSTCPARAKGANLEDDHSFLIPHNLSGDQASSPRLTWEFV